MKRYGTEYDKQAREWFVTDSKATDGYVECDTQETARTLARLLNERDTLQAALEQMVMEAEPGPGTRAMPEPSTVAMASTAIKDAKAGGAK